MLSQTVSSTTRHCSVRNAAMALVSVVYRYVKRASQLSKLGSTTTRLQLLSAYCWVWALLGLLSSSPYSHVTSADLPLAVRHRISCHQLNLSLTGNYTKESVRLMASAVIWRSKNCECCVVAKDAETNIIPRNLNYSRYLTYIP